MMKTCRISRLIEMLQSVQHDYGDIAVAVSFPDDRLPDVKSVRVATNFDDDLAEDLRAVAVIESEP